MFDSTRTVLCIWAGAAWHLSSTKNVKVTVLEAEQRAGGHAHTLDLNLDGQTVPVDTGCVSVDSGFVTVDNGFVTVDNGFVTVDNGVVTVPFFCTRRQCLYNCQHRYVTVDAVELCNRRC